jgi:hypothetical protein
MKCLIAVFVPNTKATPAQFSFRNPITGEWIMKPNFQVVEINLEYPLRNTPKEIVLEEEGFLGLKFIAVYGIY